MGHDIGIECASPEEFARRISGELIGTCETGAAFAWPLIREMIPGLRAIVVLRSPKDVAASLERFGFVDVLPEMERRFADLMRIASEPGVITVHSEILSQSDTCAAIYQHCLGEPLDLAWFQHMDAMNVQVDMPRRIDRLRTNHARIEALKASVRERLCRNM